MFNVVTIANKRYVHFVQRLFNSLHTSRNDFHLTVFCDDAETFRVLGHGTSCTVRELPEIESLGLPRARFAAYAIALQEGGFLYLDSDVIVLKPIEELAKHNQITGCHDDLSCVPIIPDKLHPWPGDPDLENRCFINAGAFFAPRARREFFKELLQRSRNDELWRRYGNLQDNSFLCAHLNLLDEGVYYVDPLVYNWQGLVINGKLQVERKGNSLVNYKTGQALKIAHFAGVPDPDSTMCMWPVEVTALLAAYGSGTGSSRSRSLVEFLGTLNPDLDEEGADPVPRAALNALVHETVGLTSHHFHRNSTAHESYFLDCEAMLSLIYSKPPTTGSWNGLPCGGSNLEGGEYNFLLNAIRELHVETAIHNGRAEISLFFRDFCVEAISIQETTKNCLDRASGELSTADLRQAIESSGVKKFDMLVLTAPLTARATWQLVRMVQPKYVALHDVHRVLAPAFSLQQLFGARLVGYLESLRGFVLLAFPGPADQVRVEDSPSSDESGEKLVNPRIQIQLADEHITLLPGDHRRILITVTNNGNQVLSPRSAFPIALSYHWMTPDHEVRLWDGIRSTLPFDILPGCAATFEARIGPAPDSSCSILCVTLVQENVGWFEQSDPANRLLLRLKGDQAVAA